MKKLFTSISPFFSLTSKKWSYLFLTGWLAGAIPGLTSVPSLVKAQAIEQACSPLSTLPCSQLSVSLPYNLNFNAPVSNTLTDKANNGTGFTLVLPYSGSRLTEDGPVSNPGVPGYEPGKLTLTGGSLQIVTNKGFAFTTSNNQLNTLAVQVDSRNKLQLETSLINPYYGTASQQGGLFIGLSDKTYIKLVVTGNKVELRREVNDASVTNDQRITGTITGLNNQTVRLRLIVDPATNTAEAFYSTDGSTYLNVGATYTTKTISISGMGLTSTSAYAGIFASHRNGTTPVTFSFNDFAVTGTNTPVQQTLTFTPKRLSFTATQGTAVTSQNTQLAANSGTPAITLSKTTTADWLTLPVAQTGTLTFGANQINTNLTPGTYSASVVAKATGYQADTLHIQLTVTTPTTGQAKINFQPASSATPAGYKADTGLPFDTTRGLGWIDPVTAQPKDNTANMRIRSTSDDLTLRTVASLQGTSPAIWEYTLANGLYNVTVSAGDASFYDSNHRLNVEGITAISNFIPTSSQRFRSATVVVEVRDGKLTIDANGGTNSKINYVLISPATAAADNIAPAVSVKLNGVIQSPGNYRNEAVVTVQASDNGGSGLDSVYYSINNGPYTFYAAPFKLTEAGNYTIRAKAKDRNKNTTVSSDYAFQITKATASNAYLLVENSDKFPAADQLTFSLIQIPWRRTNPDGTFTPYNENHNKVKLKLTNKGSGALTINNLALSNPEAWKIDSLNHVVYDAATALPLTLAKNGTAEIWIQFIAKNAGTGVAILNDTLIITSNDDLQPYKIIKLRGLWQYKGEGVNEPDAQQIINAFGFKSVTAYGHNDGTIKGQTLVPNSDEVEASYFVTADPSKPVSVVQMAAYHGCCASTERIQWYDKATVTIKNIIVHDPLDGQSLLPRKLNTNTVASGTFTSTTAFGFRSAGFFSDRTKNPDQLIALRFWKVRDENGNIIPDAYIIGQDYINNPGVTNYDYQDNMYYVSNIRLENGPVNAPVLATAPSNLAFGAVNTNATKTMAVSLTNPGQTYADGKSDPAIQITAVEITGANVSDFIANMPAATTLAAKASTTVNVTFKPASRGLKNAALLVHYNNGVSPLRIPLYGIANDANTSINVVKRIKGAADANVTINGITWEADKNYRKGSIKLDKQVTLGPVAATDDDVLYQTYLSAAANLAETRYEVPVANGTYQVRMHFVENFFNGPAGSRVFNITMENTLRLSSFDIYREVGYRAALVKDFEVTVTDGVLTVKFNPTANRVAIAAMEIYKAQAPTTVSAFAPNQQEVALPKTLNPQVRVYPNPGKKGSTVQLDVAGFTPGKDLTITIQDVMGRFVQTNQVSVNKAGEAQLTLRANLPAGLYIINAHGNTGKVQSKLIIE